MDSQAFVHSNNINSAERAAYKTPRFIKEMHLKTTFSEIHIGKVPFRKKCEVLKCANVYIYAKC